MEVSAKHVAIVNCDEIIEKRIWLKGHLHSCQTLTQFLQLLAQPQYAPISDSGMES